ncbi:MAG TPA: ATP-binding protein [Puia sp.]|nr:ATP-binding protein [Puia sp.]
MKSKLSPVLWSVYQDIAFSGLNDTNSIAQRKKIIRFNQFIILTLCGNLLSVVSYFSLSLYISALINLTAGYIFILAFHLNSRKRYELARIISIVNLNLYLIVMNYMEGLKAGEYLLYFPYFLVMTFVISVQQNFRELKFVYLITIISVLICLNVSPYENYYQVSIAGMFTRLYNSNLAISLVLTTFFSYAILRVHRDNEEAILQEKQFVDTIYNTSLDGVFIMDAEKRIIAGCNNRAVELFEFESKSEIEGTNIENWFAAEHIELFNNIAESLATNSTKDWQGELVFRSKQRTFYAFVNIVPFLDRGTRFLKISILDISEIKSAQFELMKAKQKAEVASQAKSRFLSNMSHELRTPLNGIIGASNLLIQETHLPEQKSHLDILKYSSEHMMMLISEILDFNKIEAGKLQLGQDPVDMKKFLQKITIQFAAQAHAKNLQFKTDIDDNLDIEFITDETRLNQVFSNLLSNAIKFTHQGEITLVARKVFSTSQKATIQFMVKDTGIGIPFNKQQEIFESFTQADVNTTRKYGGTGLGLAITKKLVNLFHGDLKVESEEGKGSTFHFTLKLEINPNRKIYIDENKNKSLSMFNGIRVLIAEDNAINMSIARRFLTKWGIDVKEAYNGREAVELFSKDRFDLVLIDLEMPEMDGITALGEIKKINPSIPAIAFTAAVYENMRADLIQKGFKEFVPKPFKPEDLHHKISTLITVQNRA